MKKILALGFSCTLAQAALAQENTTPAAPAKPLPVLPADCSDQIANNGLYCSGHVVKGDKITVTFAALADKGVFPDVEGLISRYTDFASWPEYVASSSQTVIEFKNNGSTLLDTLTNADGSLTYRHVYDYSLKVQGIPFLKTPVRGITYNTIVSPYDGALASLEFAAQTGPVPGFSEKPKGMKSQVGTLHALECSSLEICDEGKWLVIYETVVQPDVSFAMGIAAESVKAGIEDLLVGLLDVPAAE